MSPWSGNPPGPAAKLGDAHVLGPALDVVDSRNSVGVARDQERDVVGFLKRHHVDGQAGVEPLFVDRVVQQVDLPVPLLANLDEVGRRLHAVVEPLLPLEGPPLALVPLAGLAEAEVPGFFDPALEAACRATAARRLRCSRRAAAGSSRTGSAAAPRPWDRSGPTRPSCRRRTSKFANAGPSARATRRRTFGPSNARSARTHAGKTSRNRPRAGSDASRRHRGWIRRQM